MYTRRSRNRNSPLNPACPLITLSMVGSTEQWRALIFSKEQRQHIYFSPVSCLAQKSSFFNSYNQNIALCGFYSCKYHKTPKLFSFNGQDVITILWLCVKIWGECMDYWMLITWLEREIWSTLLSSCNIVNSHLEKVTQSVCKK